MVVLIALGSLFIIMMNAYARVIENEWWTYSDSSARLSTRSPMPVIGVLEVGGTPFSAGAARGFPVLFVLIVERECRHSISNSIFSSASRAQHSARIDKPASLRRSSTTIKREGVAVHHRALITL